MTKEDRKYFDTKFKEGREYIEKRFSYFDKKFDEIEKRLTNLEEWTKIADQKFDLVKKKFTEVDNRFDKLEEYVNSRFRTIKDSLSNFFEEIYFVRKANEMLTVKIGRLEMGYESKD